MQEPRAFDLAVNGVTLRVYEWAGEGPPVLLSHATGFHARCWDEVVRRLPGRHVIAWDMRGHGSSSKPEPPYSWDLFGADVAALVRELKIRDAVAAGHSKGGHALILAAAEVPEAFARLLLVDPVVQARGTYGRSTSDGTDHFATRRRNEWSSPDEMFESFRKRPPFASWTPEALRDYCTHGLLPNPSGEGFVLACPPAVEAATYAGAAGCDPYDAIARIRIPVRILRAKAPQPGPMDMSASPTTPDLVTYFADAEDVFVPQYSHFIPMEDPEFVAQHLRELSKQVRAAPVHP